MKYICLLVLLVILVSCNSVTVDPDKALTSSTKKNNSAEKIFLNGAIYTVNPDQPWADAVAIRDGRIVAVGSEKEVRASVSQSAELIDLKGKMLMPGFQDVHLHALEAGINETQCLFEPFLDAEAYVDELVACAEEEQPDSEWVLGAGVNIANLLEYDGFPIDLLDEAIPDRPALILDDLGHGAWANTLAMQAVGYDKFKGNPQGGVIDRDSKTGRLTGVVLENAQQKLRTAAALPTSANLQFGYEQLLNSLKILAENGITSVSDAGGYWSQGHEKMWVRALTEGKLTVRASNALYVYPDLPFDQQMIDLKSRYTNDPNSLLRFNQAKIYVDGILSQGTGLLLKPYDQLFGLPGVPKEGMAYFKTETLNRYAQQLDAAGFQLHFHVTGDKAARLALDAIEQAQTANGDHDLRHRLTHLYLVDEQDYPRFAQLNVIADFQLAPSSVDPEHVKEMEPLIGKRAYEMLPAFALSEEGATITISSDWDADDLSPFVKMATILGLDADNVPKLETIIEWMTLNPAYLLHQDSTTGSIEVGKSADLIVLDQNLFKVTPNKLSKTKVLLTLLAGKEVYRHRSAP